MNTIKEKGQFRSTRSDNSFTQTEHFPDTLSKVSFKLLPMTNTFESLDHSTRLRRCKRLTFVLAISLGLCAAPVSCHAQTVSAGDSSVFGVFVGSSPFGESIWSLLQIPADADSDLIQWRLTLYQDAKALTPAGYKLYCDYGATAPGTPGLQKKKNTVEREGQWTTSKGTKSNPDAVVYELNGAVSFFKVDDHILHVLNRDRSLMIGTGGWSYTLNRVERSEKPGDMALAMARPSQSYTISPVATGPSVFGVFEGRSPCQGIARELKLSQDAGCIKAKWRVTLYQNPETLAPTTYKVEGTLHRQDAREGNWTIIRGTETEPQAIVYCLEPTKTEAGLFLLKGDDNVLFFLDQNRKPLVGHADFSYTLNRRNISSSSARTEGRTN